MGPVTEHIVSQGGKSVIILTDMGANWWIIPGKEGAGLELGQGK